MPANAVSRPATSIGHWASHHAHDTSRSEFSAEPTQPVAYGPMTSSPNTSTTASRISATIASAVTRWRTKLRDSRRSYTMLSAHISVIIAEISVQTARVAPTIVATRL